MDFIKHALEQAVKDTYRIAREVDISLPDLKLGDFSTNIAFKLSNELKKTPSLIADEIINNLNIDKIKKIENVNGFINMWLTDEEIVSLMRRCDPTKETYQKPLKGQSIVLEFSDPNPFKALHIGHMYTSIIGDALGNLLEDRGAKVYRVNFGGDVGMHVAKAMWGILNQLKEDNELYLQNIPVEERAGFLNKSYVVGNKAYEENELLQKEIVSINKAIYKLHETNDHESELARVYWRCRGWSYDYFNRFYERIGVHFDRYYPESENSALGQKTVLKHLRDGIFKKSHGAIVFDGEKHGLHTRVFINSQGLPTYEAKDLGVALAKWRDYKFDLSIIFTGNEIVEYMKVVLKSIEQFAPNIAQKTKHITHGHVSIKGQGKMSSRKGNVLLAEEVLDIVGIANKKINNVDDTDISMAAVKFAFLKQSTGPDLAFNVEESVSVRGESGPYLQYVYVRARSILRKSVGKTLKTVPLSAKLNLEERLLIRHLSEFNHVLEKSSQTYTVHSICTYLFELAQIFNTFYEKHQVIGGEEEQFRSGLVEMTEKTMQKGLAILGISSPEKM
jgi:arginyl-tRNA synthetase